jgi:hypothetical protein
MSALLKENDFLNFHYQRVAAMRELRSSSIGQRSAANK